MPEQTNVSSKAAHTVSAYDEELQFLMRRIAEMGGVAERMVEESITALMNSDVGLSQKVISDDLLVDEAERQIGEKAVSIIARRQPMASDLRDIIASIRIAADLERIGDMAKNIAKRVIAVEGLAQPKKLLRGLEHLSELALTQLKEVLDACSTRSAELAKAVRERDEEIDAIYTSLFRELLTYMMEDPRNITACTHLLFCAKNIERIGDHATNIAESVYYIVTGEHLSAYRPKEDKTHRIVVDDTDA
jgi:phosphate transport system protein